MVISQIINLLQFTFDTQTLETNLLLLPPFEVLLSVGLFNFPNFTF